MKKIHASISAGSQATTPIRRPSTLVKEAADLKIAQRNSQVNFDTELPEQIPQNDYDDKEGQPDKSQERDISELAKELLGRGSGLGKKLDPASAKV